MRVCVMLGHLSGQLGWTPCSKGFLLLIIIWVIHIHISTSYPVGMGYSSGEECKGYCLGGIYHISNTRTHVHNTTSALWHLSAT